MNQDQNAARRHRAFPKNSLLATIGALLCVTVLTGASLPETGPVPEAKPPIVAAPDAAQTEDKNPASDPAAVPDTVPLPGPIPDEKPVDAGKATPTDTDKAKPTDGKEAAPEAKENDESAKPAEPVLVIEPEDAKANEACLADLKTIGASFAPATRIDDGKGCGIDKPLIVTDVLPGIVLEPKGTMRCETALELARWTRDFVVPAANAAVPGDKLTTLHQASTYICRLRNNAKEGKISEHARGKAVDIAAFEFASGKTIAIEKRKEDATLVGAFQRAVSASACLWFTTVLDPESDEAHEDHLHLDVLARKGGYRYCR